MRTDNAIRQYITFIIIMAICLVAGVYSGAGALLPFVVPLLIAIYSYRSRLRYAVVYVFMSASIAILLPTSLWLVILFIYGTMGIALGYYLKRRKPAEEVVFATFISVLMGLLLLLLTVQLLSAGNGLSTVVSETIDSITIPAELLDSFSQVGIGSGGNDLAELEAMLKQMMMTIMPSIFALTIFIHVVISYLLSAFSLRRLGHDIVRPIRFSSITLPGNPIVGSFLIVLLALLTSWLFADYGTVIIVNTMYLVLLLFAVQGLAVLAFAVKQLKLNVFLRIVIFIIALILIQLYGLAIVGWLEASFKIRNRINGRALK